MTTEQYFYLDMNVPRYFSEIDQKWWLKNKQKRRCCAPGCSGVPAKLEGKAVTLHYVKEPTFSLEPTAMALALSVVLWSLLLPHFPTAVVGSCIFRSEEGEWEPIPNCVSMYVPVRDRVCLRGISAYHVCSTCGAVRCKDVDYEYYLLEHEVAGRQAAMTMDRGIVVNSRMRDELISYDFRCMEFYPYRVLSTPLDNRPTRLDDWPELAEFRK